ncbi:MAG: hypothetical protein KKF12_10250 [Proteobacteria bacterium]|nr:hypothetical protein [Desulfobacula sp.]MBU3953450.1 hypothetical protein [Pseudomonadota bacterium]MBU4131188.1 hypothetical protein [Pseudomonadota bacterium]
MDFDSIISFLLILLFFVFPTIIKRLNRNKKTPGPAEKTKKLSLFEKLGDQIREYAQTLEQEAAKEKQPKETMWDHLADDNEVPITREDPVETEDYFTEPVAEPPVFAAASMIRGKKIQEIKIQEKKMRQAGPRSEKPLPASGPSAPCEFLSEGGFGRRQLSSSRLGQAIVWSEILSKPVALRER